MTAYIQQATSSITTNLTIASVLPETRAEWAALALSCTSLLVSSGAALAAWTSYFGYKWMKANATLSGTLDNCDAVQSIPAPYRLSPENGKLNARLENPIIMGTSIVIDKEQTQIPVYIQCQKRGKYSVSFKIYRCDNDKLVGSAQVLPFLKSNNYMKGYWTHIDSGRPQEYNGYGTDDLNEVDKILLEKLTSNKFYENTEGLLIKAISQYFKDRCECRMIVDARGSAHSNYYRYGFRSQSSSNNKIYASDHNLGPKPSEVMYLPDDARDLWKTEIEKFPIRKPALPG